jgi:hypothetical protein
MMRLSRDRPGYREDFFLLAERALREELNLAPYDYGPVSISWIGYYKRDVSVKVFAQVLAPLTEHELEEKFGGAESIFEARAVRWLPFTRRQVMDIVENWSGDSQGGRWSDSAPLALPEVWRMKPILSLSSD